MKDLIDRFNSGKSRVYTSYCLNNNNEKEKYSLIEPSKFQIIKISFDLEQYFKNKNVLLTEKIIECSYSTFQLTLFDYIKTTALSSDSSLKQLLDINPALIPSYIQKTYKKKHSDIKASVENIISKCNGNSLYSGKTKKLIEFINKKQYKRIIVFFRLKQSQDSIESILKSLKDISTVFISILPYRNCQV